MKLKGRIEVSGFKAFNESFVLFGFNAVLQGRSAKVTKARRSLWRQLAHLDAADMRLVFCSSPSSQEYQSRF